jgi:hypothetical protein
MPEYLQVIILLSLVMIVSFTTGYAMGLKKGNE